MNQKVYEKDNYHLDGDYKAIEATRKLKADMRSFPMDMQDVTLVEGGETTAQKAIFTAAAVNDVSTLRLYYGDEIQALNNRGYRDPKTGETALHRALANGSNNVVEFLLSTARAAELVSATYNINVNGHVSCRTTLHQATESRDIKIIQRLLAALPDREETGKLLNRSTLCLEDGRRPRSVTCLHIAAMKGFDEIVKYLVTECRVDVNQTNNCNDTALMWASLKGHQSTVDLLISLQANVNAASDQGSTALHYAVRGNYSDIVRLLLEHQADANMQRKRGLQSPLALAAALGSADIVRLLLQHGADVNARIHGSETALHYAASEGHLEVCRLLVEKDAEIDAVDSMGETALLEAARRGEVKVVSYLLRKGAHACKSTVSGCSAWTYAIDASDEHMLYVLMKQLKRVSHDVNYRNTTCSSRVENSKKCTTLPDGFLPLHEAAKRGDTVKLQALIDHGFSPDDRDPHGNTFVHAAVAANQWKIFELSEPCTHAQSAAICRTSIANNQGRTPLHEACQLAHEESVTELAKITQLDMRSNSGTTALHEAVRASSDKGRLYVVREIMKYIRQGRYWEMLDAQDYCGYTALHWAVIGGCKEVLPELQMLKLCVNDRDGNTPLHLAAASRETHMFSELLRLFPRDVRGALNQANKSGMTPLMLAIDRGSQRIIEQAILAGADLAATEPDGKTVLHWIADKLVAEESQQEMLIQSVRTILDMSVAWLARTTGEKTPENLSPQYDEFKIAALKELLGQTVDRGGLTALQYAISIGCLPFIKYILDLKGLLMTPNPDACDGTDGALDTATKPDETPTNKHFERKVHPVTGAPVGCDKNEAMLPSKETHFMLNQEANVLELIASNANTLSVAAVLGISPFCEMAQRYWNWYERLYFVGFFFHLLSICLLTGYGLSPTDVSNATEFRETNASFAKCSNFEMPLPIRLIVLVYSVSLLAVLTVSLISFFIRDLPKQICQTSGELKVGTYSHTRVHRNRDIVLWLIWKICGIVCSLTVFFSVKEDQICSSFYAYLLSAAVLFGWIYLFNYLSRFKMLYQFTLLLQNASGDFFRFFFVYILILLGFSFAQHIVIVKDQNYAKHDLLRTVFFTFQWLVGMNNFWDIYGSPDNSYQFYGVDWFRYVFLAFVFIAYIAICAIILINMLLATMSDCFAEIRKNSDQLWKVDSLRQALKFQRNVASLISFLLCCRSMRAAREYWFNKFTNNQRQLHWLVEFLEASRIRKSNNQNRGISEARMKGDSPEIVQHYVA